MLAKPAATSRPRLLSKLTAGAKRFASTLSDRAVVDGSVGLFIVIALSILLLRSYQRPQIDPLPAGAIATADVIAPDDIGPLEDPEETVRLRSQRENTVLPVFDFNPRVTRDIRNSIAEMFATGRQFISEAPDPLRQRIKDASGVILDLEQVGVLIKHSFDSELERLMIDQAESVMMTGVVDRRSQLIRLGSTGIIRRDVKTGQEVAINDLSSIRDLITAHAELRSDKLVLPSDYSPIERRLVGEVLSSLIVPNLFHNEEETGGRKAAARESIATQTVSVARGKLIVSRGETVTPAKALLLEAASRHRPIGQRAVEFAGTVVIVMLLVLVLWQYLVRYQQRHLRVRRHFLLQITSFAITLVLARLFFSFAFAMSQWTTVSPFNSQIAYKYLAPLALGAGLVTVLTDAHAAFVFSAILAVFIGVLSGDVHLAAYTMVASVGAIYHLQSCRDRTALVRAGLWIGLVNASAALALDLLGASPRLFSEPGLESLGLVLFDCLCGLMSGVLAAMVASIVLPMFEWLFEITTSIKLLELSNLNLPLLRQLAERAPGTYHHSIMVGLLAEAAAEAIRADALFTRVACYYHDIGKMMRPAYFVENQSYLENRHDNLAPRMSSIILANHVKQGLELARQYKLPPRIAAIIPQHHGTGLMKYFYYKARQSAEESDSAALEREFRYPGPKPQTKEAAIIMIADSVEAAARTVNEPTPAKLRNMIDLVIERIRDDGQFDECDITLRELRIVADTFVKVLMGIHHHRIAYPGYDFNKTGTAAASSSAEAPSGPHPVLAAEATPIDSGEVKLRGARGD
jgi:hypothetical protein